VKITFLLYNAYGIGGTIRSTVNLSRALSARHEVEIVSVHRTQDEPRLSFGPDVRLTSLLDWRPDSAGYDGATPAASEPSAIFHDPGVANGPLAPSRLTDERIAAHLQASDADVIIATRPALVGYLARHGSDRQLRIGQEHVLLQMHSEQLGTDQNAALDGLDAFVTVSAADADDLPRRATGHAHAHHQHPELHPRPRGDAVHRRLAQPSSLRAGSSPSNATTGFSTPSPRSPPAGPTGPCACTGAAARRPHCASRSRDSA